MSYKYKLNNYFSASRAEFRIPDISDGFIPQGIAFDQNSGCFFLSGYMTGFRSSPIYAVKNSSGELCAKVYLCTDDNKPYRGHAGGISIINGILYLAGSTESCMYSYPVDEILSKPMGSHLSAAARHTLESDNDHIRASFTSSDDSFLYVGEFHNSPLFKTAKTHKVVTASGRQHALLVGLHCDDSGVLTAVNAFSIPDNIQGAAFCGGYLFLSEASGLRSAKIKTYKLESVMDSYSTIQILGSDVPLYILDGNLAYKETTIPPLSEEIVVYDNRLYILHEAASNLYRIGKRIGLDMVYSTPIEFFLD